jgi:hypothetical protein
MFTFVQRKTKTTKKMTTTTYTYDFNGKSFTREFCSLGSITIYVNGLHARYYDCGSVGLFMAETQFLFQLAEQNVEYTKTVAEA